MKITPASAEKSQESLERELVTRRERAAEALHLGDLPVALDQYSAALRTAREIGDPVQVDLAFCDYSAVAIELGSPTEALAGLRQILVRSADVSNSCRAAYNVARIYELDKHWKKALFYARVARDHAYKGANDDWRARCHNLLGNLLLAESQLDEAVTEYRRALELIPDSEETWKAFILDNLGYGRLLLDDREGAFSLLFQSLRTFRRLGLDRFAIEPHLDLCFAYLEIGRYRAAKRHGEKALHWATELGEVKAHKNALYLLGQTAVLMQREDEAKRYFHELQVSHYPDRPGMIDFLLAVDVRQLVNLKA